MPTTRRLTEFLMGPGFFPADAPNEWLLIYSTAVDDLRARMQEHRNLASLAGLDRVPGDQLAFELWEIVYRAPARVRARLQELTSVAYSAGVRGEAMPVEVIEFMNRPDIGGAGLAVGDLMQRAWKEGDSTVQRGGAPTVGWFWNRRRRPLPEEPVTDQRGEVIEVGDRVRDLATDEWLEVVDILVEPDFDNPVVLLQPGYGFGGKERRVYTIGRGNRYELMDDLIVRAARSATEMRRKRAVAGRRIAHRRPRGLPYQG